MMKRIQCIAPIEKGNPDDLLIVSASFELERSLAAVSIMDDYRTKCGIVLNLLSKKNLVGQQRQARAVRLLSRAIAPMDSSGVARTISVNPFDYISTISELADEMRRRSIGTSGMNATIDISCFNRVQFIMLLQLILREGWCKRLRLIYTYPEHYNEKSDKFRRLSVGGYTPIRLPIWVSGSRSLAESYRVAVVVLGHEGQRTMSAWRFSDADETILICPASKTPSGREVWRRENSFLLRHPSYEFHLFHQLECDVFDVTKARERLSSLLRARAKSRKVRASLIPFGPKPVAVGALLGLMDVQEVDSDLVYCIPRSYNSDFSSGVSGVYSLELSDRMVLSRESRTAEASRDGLTK